MQFQVLISGLLLLLSAAVDSFTEVHGEVGHFVTLPCTYPVSSGVSSVCWGHGACASDTCGHTLVWIDGYRIYYRTTNRYQIKGQFLQGNVSLTIENATESDSGLYCCQVEMKGWSGVQRLTTSLQVQAGVPTSSSRGLTITGSFKPTKRSKHTPRKIIITPKKPITIQRRPPTTPRRPPTTPRRPPTTPRRPLTTPRRPPTTPRRPTTTPRRPTATPRRTTATTRRPTTTTRRPTTTTRRTTPTKRRPTTTTRRTPTTTRRPTTTTRRPTSTTRRPTTTTRRTTTTTRRPTTTTRRPTTTTRRPTTTTRRTTTTTRRPTTTTRRPTTTTRRPSITRPTRRLTNAPISTRIYASTPPLPVYTQTLKPVYTTIVTSSHHPWNIHTEVVPTPNTQKINTKGVYIGISVSVVLLILMSILMIIKFRHTRMKKSEIKSPRSSVVFHAYPNEAFQSTTQIQTEDNFTDDSFYSNVSS